MGYFQEALHRNQRAFGYVLCRLHRHDAGSMYPSRESLGRYKNAARELHKYDSILLL